MYFSIPDFLTDEQSFGVFLLVSVCMGGGAAWLAGRAIAATWRPWWHIALYMALLSLAVLPPDARKPDGDSLQLDQSAKRTAALATPRPIVRPQHDKNRMTFPSFAA